MVGSLNFGVCLVEVRGPPRLSHPRPRPPRPAWAGALRAAAIEVLPKVLWRRAIMLDGWGEVVAGRRFAAVGWLAGVG